LNGTHQLVASVDGDENYYMFKPRHQTVGQNHNIKPIRPWKCDRFQTSGNKSKLCL